ncbi:MAG: thiamine phosphate synthase [bacterium]|nr:thiamine phosphate synthase [bacterium]
MEKKQFCHFCGANLVEKFFEGRERKYCESCDLPIYENPVPATAAVVPNKAGDILLVKRKVEPKIGQWCLPGGFLELGERPEEGCLRELHEETGLSGEVSLLLGNEPGKHPAYHSVLVMGYAVENVSGEIQAGDDCDEAQFFPRNALPPVAFRSHREILANALELTPEAENTVDKRGGGLSKDSETFAGDADSCEGSSHTPSGRGMAGGNWGAYVITSGNHADIAREAAKAGAKILQYRDKKATRKRLLETAVEIRKITREYGTLFIINDYIDIALMVGADGVHLGQDDIPIGEARKVTPDGFIIGISTHSLEQAMEAEKQGADYIGSGPVFATPTKENYIPIGVSTLRNVLGTVKIPVVAIGGLNPENLSIVKEAGAKNTAMVRAFQENTKSVITKINRELLA